MRPTMSGCTAWVTVALAATAACGFESHSSGGGGGGSDGGGSEGSDGSMPDPNDVCYGPPDAWRVCFAKAPAGDVSLPMKLDTDKSPLCAQGQPRGWTPAQPAACVIAGNTIASSLMTTTVIGTRPLVLVAHTSIAISSPLEFAGDQAENNNAALGWPTASCPAFSETPGAGGGDGAGGGAGGSFMTRGGNGGQGGSDVDNQNGQSAELVPAPPRPSQLRPGCPGQVGGARGDGDGGAGRGGGALYLLTRGAIEISSAVNASGAGGSGGRRRTGGSGGGSGGMIVLYAASIAISGAVLANGGGGAGGGDQSSDGTDGEDPDPVAPETPAAGGGNGGKGFPARDDDLDGTGGSQQADGGGGGGGGAGYIRANHDVPAMRVSPRADIVPGPP